MTTLLLATRNAHKIAEIRAILGERFRYLTLQDFPQAPAVIEDQTTFAGNATKKTTQLAGWLAAQALSRGAQASAWWVLADDSGLEVDALNGQPGVHSARFAALDSRSAGNTPDADNNAKLLRLLKDVPRENRSARFRCVLALTSVMAAPVENASPVCYADEFTLPTRLFDGVCEGRMLFAANGRGGFGYDPLFAPEGFDLSFAELGEDVKNRISHRARALARLNVALGP